MSSTNDTIFNGLLEKIEETSKLIQDCNKLIDVSGKAKLQRKIEAELRFLKKLSQNREKLKEEHIRSSNIYHLTAIVQSCIEMQGVVKVLETFSYTIEENEELYDIPLVVDIVADYGKTWVKVATRNPHHLYLASVGHGKYGRKSIVEQVKDMVECANQNPHMFQPPKVIVRLAAGVTKELKELLEQLNVEVIGDIVNSISEDNSSLSNNEHSEFVDTLQNEMLSLKNIRLDTEEISCCSSSDTTFFDSNDESRKLVCCETAHKDFLEILSTVGGESEKHRASEILKKVTVLSDNPSLKAADLEKTSKIKERSKIVFGTGDSLKAVTVSANLGFLRAAQSQGIKFVAFVHESRALTECKELKPEDL
ncbi:hypothetical protein JTE90_003092 [Oedothorax gibbosus]|uniref:DUF1308 domain-containing protein n=1 Tax=Oedothorax gibbosus TaxID=931172 RepID=A0AAV6VD77_9ARAC|nr:hypothetical protein JTE90_003092 [Oedothorax gibbosus]